jgi:hypothetical protein
LSDHSDDTDVMTAVLTADRHGADDTADKTADHADNTADLDPGTYRLNLDSCAIEVSVRLFGFTIARARLRALDGRFTTAEIPLVAAIEVDVAPRLVRVNMPFLGDRLNRSVPRRLKLRFTAAGIDAAGAPPWAARQPVPLAGELSTEPVDPAGEPDGTPVGSLPLTARFIRFDNREVVLSVRGPARPTHPSTSFLHSRMWVEAAAEFTR